jgi:hypothetical protein
MAWTIRILNVIIVSAVLGEDLRFRFNQMDQGAVLIRNAEDNDRLKENFLATAPEGIAVSSNDPVGAEGGFASKIFVASAASFFTNPNSQPSTYTSNEPKDFMNGIVGSLKNYQTEIENLSKDRMKSDQKAIKAFTYLHSLRGGLLSVHLTKGASKKGIIKTNMIGGSSIIVFRQSPLDGRQQLYCYLPVFVIGTDKKTETESSYFASNKKGYNRNEIDSSEFEVEANDIVLATNFVITDQVKIEHLTYLFNLSISFYLKNRHFLNNEKEITETIENFKKQIVNLPATDHANGNELKEVGKRSGHEKEESLKLNSINHSESKDSPVTVLGVDPPPKITKLQFSNRIKYKSFGSENKNLIGNKKGEIETPVVGLKFTRDPKIGRKTKMENAESRENAHMKSQENHGQGERNSKSKDHRQLSLDFMKDLGINSLSTSQKFTNQLPENFIKEKNDKNIETESTNSSKISKSKITTLFDSSIEMKNSICSDKDDEKSESPIIRSKSPLINGIPKIQNENSKYSITIPETRSHLVIDQNENSFFKNTNLCQGLSTSSKITSKSCFMPLNVLSLLTERFQFTSEGLERFVNKMEPENFAQMLLNGLSTITNNFGLGDEESGDAVIGKRHAPGTISLVVGFIIPESCINCEHKFKTFPSHIEFEELKNKALK